MKPAPAPRALLLLLAAAAFGGCDRPPAGRDGPRPDAAARAQVQLPERDARLCTAVAVLLDTSSSMLQNVRDRAGRQRPKHEIARESLEAILEHTGDWLKSHADTQLELGIFQFSSGVTELLPMGPFDLSSATAAVGKARQSSGTAIGRALEAAYKSLYGSGCTRKHIVCITDGENTSGPSPEAVSRLYHEATEGAVKIHMVAFNVSSKKFSFLRQVGGDVVQADDGGQLQAQLSEIYDRRIFAEEMPAEE